MIYKGNNWIYFCIYDSLDGWAFGCMLTFSNFAIQFGPFRFSILWRDIV